MSAATISTVERPGSVEEAAAVMAGCGARGLSVRARGGGTKWGWGRAVPPPDLIVETGGLTGVVEHNPGDLTAVIRAGTSLSTVQEALAGAGQMLAVDPPGPDPGGATLGGILATGDSGPLRHHYGTLRNLVLGVTVVLSDGTVARSGGKVIKNVAGYDLGKLLGGSFGTLGLVVEVAVRLHPRPRHTATVVGRSGDPAALARAAALLGGAPPGLARCLDVVWEAGAGAVLVQVAGSDPGGAAARVSALLTEAGLAIGHADPGHSRDDRPASHPRPAHSQAGSGAGAEVRLGDDPALWVAQAQGQRSLDGTVVKVSALPSALTEVLDAADALGAGLTGRAGLGLSWLRLPAGPPADAVAAVDELRARLAPSACVVLDAPDAVRRALDPWGPTTGPVALMRRVKGRFDPAGVCAPGLFVDGI